MKNKANTWIKRIMKGLDEIIDRKKVYLDDYLDNGVIHASTVFLRGERDHRTKSGVIGMGAYRISKEIEDMIDKKRGQKVWKE